MKNFATLRDVRFKWIGWMWQYLYWTNWWAPRAQLTILVLVEWFQLTKSSLPLVKLHPVWTRETEARSGCRFILVDKYIIAYEVCTISGELHMGPEFNVFVVCATLNNIYWWAPRAQFMMFWLSVLQNKS